MKTITYYKPIKPEEYDPNTCKCFIDMTGQLPSRERIYVQPIDGLHIPEVDGLNIIKDLNQRIKDLESKLTDIRNSAILADKESVTRFDYKENCDVLIEKILSMTRVQT